MPAIDDVLKRYISGVATTIAMCASISPVQAQDVFTIKFGATGRNDPMHTYMRDFKECAEANSDGRIVVEMYPASQLGSMPQMAQGVQLGTIEMIVLAPQHLRGIDPRFGVVEAPGLFKDVAHSNRAYWHEEFHDAYLSAGNDTGLRGLAIFAYGPTVYLTKEPIRELDDFSGMRLRVLATAIEQELVESLGATGVNVAWPEVTGALQRNQIDGLRTALAIGTALQMYTGAPYATLTEEAVIPVAVFASQSFLDKLPKDLNGLLKQCARETERGMTRVAEDFYEEAQQGWTEGGGEVLRLSDAEQMRFLERAAGIGDEVYEAESSEVRTMYERLRRAAESTVN